MYTIRTIKGRIEVAEKEIEEAKKEVYDLRSIDYAKDKVDGGEMADLSDKVVQAEKKVEKLKTHKKHLDEMREEARERINALRDMDSQNVLISFFILVEPIERMQKEMSYSRSGIYTLLRKSIRYFDKTYRDWLANIEM